MRLLSLRLLAVMVLVVSCEAPAPTPEIAAPTRFPSPLAPQPTPILNLSTDRVLGGAIAASVFRNGHWDIYVLSAQGELLRRVTLGEGDNRAPSWSPDGTSIAFESNREHNWDIYVIGADGSNLKRLTTDIRYDGSPRWSPDGKQIAFTSDRDGDLDVWVMNADGSSPLNLTSKSPALDFDPTWSPDGKQIAFTSMRDGNKEIYVMAADGSNPRNLTQSKSSEEEQAAWSPQGATLAFVSEHDGVRELNLLNLAAPQNWKRLTQFEHDQSPAWSPDGSSLVFGEQTEDAQALCLSVIGQHRITQLTLDRLWYHQPDWNLHASAQRDEQSLRRGDAPLYVEKTTPNPTDRPDRYNFVTLYDVRAIVPMLSDSVDDSFYAMRQRVLDEAGWDFLASLSEAARPLTFKSNASDYLSWHKAGRAIDLQQDVLSSRGRLMEVAREDVLGFTYWRVYLKTARQDGSQGEPLRQVLWDVSQTTRARAPGLGGVPKGVPGGYYVDFTELARRYGWERIHAHTLRTFDWRRDFLALEYWHYQKMDGLSWWQALHEVYTPKQIGDLFSYDNLLDQKYDVLTMIEKGIPLPADVRAHYASIQP